MVERIQCNDEWINLINKSSFEVLAGQFQSKTDKIICVKDGVDLLIYSQGSEIPQYLRKESIRRQGLTGVTEYYYRTPDESMYAFFDIRIHEWIMGNRQTRLDMSIGAPKMTEIARSVEQANIQNLTRPIIAPTNSTYSVVPTWGCQNKEPVQSQPIQNADLKTVTETLTGRVISVVIEQGAQMTVETIDITK